MVVQRLVSEVMTQPVISVTPQTPLQEAVKLLSEHHISGFARGGWRQARW